MTRRTQATFLIKKPCQLNWTLLRMLSRTALRQSCTSTLLSWTQLNWILRLTSTPRWMWLWRGLTQTLTTSRISLAKGSSTSTLSRLRCILDSKITHSVNKLCQCSPLLMPMMSLSGIWAPCLSSIHGGTWFGRIRLKSSYLQSGRLQCTMTTRTKQQTKSFSDTLSSSRMHRPTSCTLTKLSTSKRCKLE